jgi:hypothetical protein
VAHPFPNSFSHRAATSVATLLPMMFTRARNMLIPRDNAYETPYTRLEPSKGGERRMTHKAKDLSPDQKVVIESLLGRSIAENEEISILATTSPTAPEWLQSSWQSAKEQGLDRLSMEEIDAEIADARKARREGRRREQ